MTNKFEQVSLRTPRSLREIISRRDAEGAEIKFRLNFLT